MSPAFIHRAVVLHRTGLRSSELDRLIKEKRFPPPARERGELFWRRSEVHEWLESGAVLKWVAEYKLNRRKTA
jgi:predicted DNA-binding transcriptional regulator AlpA